MSSKANILGSLADVYQSENLDGTITKIRLESLIPSEVQPRWNRTQSVDELAQSIAKDGLLSPIIVCKEGDLYRIIAGERRYHAIKKLNYLDIECRIISRQEKDYWRIAIIENLQRENLFPWEEANALSQLKKNENLNDTEIGKLIGKSRNYVVEILSLSVLPEEVVESCKNMGLQQRNMLIEVTRAYKKGEIENFLEAYRTGQITTVKKAKKFRQSSNPPINKKLQTKKAKQQFKLIEKMSDCEIWASELQISIQCKNENSKDQLLGILQNSNIFKKIENQ